MTITQKAKIQILGKYGNETKDECNEKGCQCFCEIQATADGQCEVKKHLGYRLMKYNTTGKLLV